jgi:hypothetical protein
VKPIRQASSEARQLGQLGQLGPTRWSQSPGQAGLPARPRPGQTPVRQSSPGTGPRVAWLRSSVFRAALNARTEGCVSRRDLKLTTVRQGEQGRRGGHMPGCARRTIGSATTGARDLSRPRNRPRPSGAAAPRSPRRSRSSSRRRHRGCRPRSCGRPRRHPCRFAHAHVRPFMSV